MADTEIRQVLAQHFQCDVDEITHYAVVCEYLKNDELNVGWSWSSSAIWQIEGIVRRLLVEIMVTMGLRSAE